MQDWNPRVRHLRLAAGVNIPQQSHDRHSRIYPIREISCARIRKFVVLNRKTTETSIIPFRVPRFSDLLLSWMDFTDLRNRNRYSKLGPLYSQQSLHITIILRKMLPLSPKSEYATIPYNIIGSFTRTPAGAEMPLLRYYVIIPLLSCNFYCFFTTRLLKRC